VLRSDLSPRLLRRVGGYRELAAPPGLEHVVDASWVYETPVAPAHAPAVTHRILPELGISLFFECWRDSTGRVLFGDLALQGPIRRVQLFAPAGSQRIEAVRVKVEWCRDLFGADATEHADRISLYRALGRARADRLYDRLTRTRSTADALRELLREVRERYQHVSHSHSLRVANGAAELIRASGREVALSGVARRVGVTERHLRRVLRVATGIGPKQFHRIHRLNHAVAAADRSARPPWAHIAAEAGYFDQSHMIQEFRAIAGRAPGELHVERQAENVGNRESGIGNRDQGLGTRD
jgi:AraC-like DNA-binding protein